jgi:hypothetical protein
MGKRRTLWAVIDNHGVVYTSTIKRTRKASIDEWMRQVRPGSSVKAARMWGWWRRQAKYVCTKIVIGTVAQVPDDTKRLVIAARSVAFGDFPPSRASIKELDRASEAFASRVPWDDEPQQKGQNHG